MSLYYEAAKVLENAEGRGGSLKSRVYGSKDLKSTPAQVFALVTEATKWSPILKDVIEKSGILREEKKLTPVLALLLVHDLLLAKKGLSAPANHPLKLAITRHKSRLNAELTRLRVKMGFGSLKALKTHMESSGASTSQSTTDMKPNGETKEVFRHPRWVRVNTIQSPSKKQISDAFAGFKRVATLAEVMRSTASDRVFHVDEHIPELVALPPGFDLSKTDSYQSGALILQDKASCFPAYLLNPQSLDGDIIDTCAAPGNKTTHLASLVKSAQRKAQNTVPRRVYAYERDKARYKTLKKMTSAAGADACVTARNQDFLSVDPHSEEMQNVTALLLDPSCSGSGIVGRDDEPTIALPSPKDASPGTPSRKRKRRSSASAAPPLAVEDEPEQPPLDMENDAALQSRLISLAEFQLKLLLHAMQFPSARTITYSTCSIHAEENEFVVLKALTSSLAEERGWRILTRHEQVEGMSNWHVRGGIVACTAFRKEYQKSKAMVNGRSPSILSNYTLGHIAEACIRCEKGTKDGTMGFFVAAFVRDVEDDLVQSRASTPGSRKDVEDMLDTPMTDQVSDDVWEGFSD